MYRFSNIEGVCIENCGLDLKNSDPRVGEAGSSFIRMMDVVIALIAILALLPLLLTTALLVWLQDGGPALYSQERIGRSGRTFRCHKFRTMAVDSQARLAELLRNDPSARLEWEKTHKLKNDPRITPFGRFLRTTSIDELPQLINILRGEMSLVGPRPIVHDEVVKYGRAFRHYAAVPPGLTGLWQVSGRNDVDYNERVALDVLYVRNRSLTYNLEIIARTVPAVLTRHGSY